ncbi:MAG: HD domain-containing phosphohydrolase [Dissulfurispiraceae bacterium]|jgi:putative nucleotidyltransferase with HDIG domain
MGTTTRVIEVDAEGGNKSGKSTEDSYDFIERKKFKEYSDRKETLFQTEKNAFVPGTQINFTLYKQHRADFEPFIKADEKSPALLTAEMLSEVLGSRSEIMIERTDIERYHSYLKAVSALPGLSEDNSYRQKTFAMKEDAKIVMKELLDDPRSGEKIKEAKNVVSTLVNAVLDNSEMLFNMVTLSKYDYYTYTHCVNVATLSIGLAIAVGLEKQRVENLGIGAILHDVGKTAIPAELINKQGRLNELEFMRVKEHVREGEALLVGNKDIPKESLDAVLQHHEKLSGKGYPLHLKGDEIKLFGRIAAIADCYDALTTQRSYKPALKPFEALKIIAKEINDFDRPLLKEFIGMLGKIKP